VVTGTARQALRCEELLGAACGVRVRMEFSGRPAPGLWGGWVVQWCDGPTEAQMRAVAAQVLPPTGDRTPPADQLSYGRCLSTVGEATALLMWLEAHPEALVGIGAVHLLAARDEVPYPERADGLARARSRSLLRRSPSGTLGYDVLLELATRGHRGWGTVLAWLDTAADPPPVVDLAVERARRRAR